MKHPTSRIKRTLSKEKKKKKEEEEERFHITFPLVILNVHSNMLYAQIIYGKIMRFKIITVALPRDWTFL